MEPMTFKESIEFVKAINEMIENAVAKRFASKPEDPYQSEQTNELVTALAKAQSEYPTIGNNRVNPFFKSEYADFDSIMSVIRPTLSKNGLVLNQYTVVDQENNARTLHTRLMHSSGQWIESRERIIPEKNDDQRWASTVTFKKRHQAMAILNITIDRDRYDDDAETNVKDSRIQEIKGTALNTMYQPNEQTYAVLNTHQYMEINNALKGHPDLVKALLDKYKISTVADLPQDKYEYILKQIRANVEQRNRGTVPVSK